jgi:DNA-3-methyladenine glycosylase
MTTGGRFTAGFFARPCLEVAPELLGAYLVHRLDDGIRLVARIVEVEAYLGDGTDPGAHTHRGPTPRNRAMFGPPGRLYVYRSYGVHTCANVVCEPRGFGAAVLLRAVEPVEGEDRMRLGRGLAAGAEAVAIGSGPGKLTQAMGVTLDDYGQSLLNGRLCLRRPAPGAPPIRIGTSRRIGLSKGSALRYRFFVIGNPHVSRARPARKRRAASRRCQ